MKSQYSSFCVKSNKQLEIKMKTKVFQLLFATHVCRGAGQVVPEFQSKLEWLNSPPLSVKKVRTLTFLQ